MFYGIAADITVVIHLIWIVFLIFGAFIGRKHRRIRQVHIGALAFAVIIQVMGWYCPLTHLEIWLRRMRDPSHGYSGSFIAHYAEKLVYLEVSGALILVLTIVLVAVSVWLYLPGWRKRP